MRTTGIYTLGHNYGFQRDSFGNILIRREEDSAEVYLQGDDARELEKDLDALETIDYPCGPFTDYESHLDMILGQYSEVLL